MNTSLPVFYRLPARLLEEGMSTDDGQDILSVTSDPDGLVFAEVYTPRSDDPELNQQNRCEPETRLYQANDWVDLAVFEDTDVDGSDYADADLVAR
jgi:hypothetical protein